MKIKILNPVACQIERRYGELLEPALSCTAEYYREEPIPNTDRTRKVRYEYNKHFFLRKTGRHWYFLRGHLERAQEHIKEVTGEPAEIISNVKEFVGPSALPTLNGIIFRDDQLRLMQLALTDQIGVILSPTGSGKTILQLGLMSCFPKRRLLLLAHTIGIISQTFEELRKFGFKDIQQIGGGKRFKGKFERIVVSTVQSFRKINPDLYRDYFDVVMVDEAHRVSSLNVTFTKVLQNLMAPVRLGFTATLPTSEEAQMTIEGLIGPVIGELTVQEAAELEILAVPKVKLLKTEFSHTIKEIRRYAEVYQQGVVENSARNQLIADTVQKHSKMGDITLIFVNRIEHGKLLQEEFAELRENVPFVEGNMNPKERENIRHSLIERRRRIAIATTAWREGINIPSLDVIFNAGGGKDELGVLQLIGRGLRRTSSKEKVLIYDIFDPSHHYLISHFGERITLYMKKEWI